MGDKDGWAKNVSVVWDQVKDSAKVWKADFKQSWELMEEAADDRDILEVLHKMTALVGDTLKFFLRLDRLWLYTIIALAGAYVASRYGVFQWPLTWVGF